MDLEINLQSIIKVNISEEQRNEEDEYKKFCKLLSRLIYDKYIQENHFFYIYMKLLKLLKYYKELEKEKNELIKNKSTTLHDDDHKKEKEIYNILEYKIETIEKLKKEIKQYENKLKNRINLMDIDNKYENDENDEIIIYHETRIKKFNRKEFEEGKERGEWYDRSQISYLNNYLDIVESYISDIQISKYLNSSVKNETKTIKNFYIEIINIINKWIYKINNNNKITKEKFMINNVSEDDNIIKPEVEPLDDDEVIDEDEEINKFNKYIKQHILSYQDSIYNTYIFSNTIYKYEEIFINIRCIETLYGLMKYKSNEYVDKNVEEESLDNEDIKTDATKIIIYDYTPYKSLDLTLNEYSEEIEKTKNLLIYYFDEIYPKLLDDDNNINTAIVDKDGDLLWKTKKMKKQMMMKIWWKMKIK